MNALQFNRRQNYPVETIRRIQMTVGAGSDGSFGPATLRAIKRWQRAHGMSVDGKVGSGTLAKFEELWAADAEVPSGEVELDDVSPEEGESFELETSDEDAEEDLFPTPVRAVGYLGGRQLSRGAEGSEVVTLQNDLFAFGFGLEKPDGHFGDGTGDTVQAFQRVAATPHRIADYQRLELPSDQCFRGQAHGRVDAQTLDELAKWKASGWRWQDPASNFQQRRVRVRDRGCMPRSSQLLVDISGVQGKRMRLHRVVARDYEAMISAAKTGAGVNLLACSSWRPHRWKSKAHYDQVVTKKYGSVAEGRKWLAFSSPHETGLCVDFGTEGLSPNRKTIPKQKATAAYAWLVDNAYRFGWMPYKREPWHWEHPISLRAWMTGESDWELDDEPDIA